MKKSFFSIVFVNLFAAGCWAQSSQFVQAPIIVQRGDLVFQTASLDEAIGTIAQDGDVIYLPGGDFSISSPISRSVHIFGSGWRADSAASWNNKPTRITATSGTLRLNAGASGGSLNGVAIPGNIYNESGQNLASYTVSRCWFIGLEFKNWASQDLKIDIKSSVLYWVRADAGTLNLQNCLVVNSNFDGNSNLLNLENCVLTHVGGLNSDMFYDWNTVTMKNSIVFHNLTNAYFFAQFSDIVILTDNLFVGNPGGLPGYVAQYNNIIREEIFRKDVFIDYVSNQPFLEEYDYHTQGNCMQCADKGIYFGSAPYKDVPENPYITARAVSIQSDGQSLKLNFTINKGAN